MTITSIQRPTSLQTYSHTSNSNYTQSDYNAPQSEIEFYIQSLINEGNIFKAKYHMQMVNTLNGYPVISQMQFKQWHIDFLKNKNQNNEISNIKVSNVQKDFSKNKRGSFQTEYQKAYMKLISN